MHGCHIVILHYTKNYLNKIAYFSKIYYHTPFGDHILSVASIAATHKFMHLPCCYDQVQEI